MPPAPKPAKIAERDGTHKSRIKHSLQGKAKRGHPLMPANIRKMRYSAPFWTWCCNTLGIEGLDILTDHDQKILEVAAGVYHRMREAENQCNQKGCSIETYNADGEMISCKRAPWDIAYRDYSTQLSKLLSDLALTPSARSKYVIPEGEQTGDVEEDTRRMIKKFDPSGA